jgi:hypothetical protein
MPITLNQNEASNVLEVVVSGKLTHEDYETFVPRVEQMVKEHGKIRVLFDMVDFHGWEATALWDDTKFTFKHFSDISRIAMVGDKKWEKAMSAFCGPFTSAEVRYFDWSELNEARAWLEVPRKETLRHAVMSMGRSA